MHQDFPRVKGDILTFLNLKVGACCFILSFFGFIFLREQKIGSGRYQQVSMYEDCKSPLRLCLLSVTLRGHEIVLESLASSSK